MSIEKLSTNASLKEVMDKFEEISIQDLSSINIKVVSKLPNNAKEGDIVILSNYPYTKVIVSKKEPTLANNEIWLNISEDKDCNIKANKVDFVSTIADCKIKINNELVRINVYKYINNEFVHINSLLNLYVAPNYYNEDIHGGFWDYNADTSWTDVNARTDTANGIEIRLKRSMDGTSIRSIYSANKIDLSPFKTLEVKYKVVSATASSSYYVKTYAGVADNHNDMASASGINFISSVVNENIISNVGKEIVANVDISNLTNSAIVKLILYVATSTGDATILVKSMKLLR